MEGSSFRAAAGAAALCFCLCAGLSSCARPAAKAKAPGPVYPFAADVPAVFVVAAKGILPVPSGGSAERYAADYVPAPGALACRAAALAASSGGAAAAGPVSPAGSPSPAPASILVAVNRYGLLRLEPEPRAPEAKAAKKDKAKPAPAAPVLPSYRLEARPLPTSFGGLSVGGLWTRPSGFLLHLYRDPFVEGRDLAGAAAGGPSGAPGPELFALDPRGEPGPLPRLAPPAAGASAAAPRAGLAAGAASGGAAGGAAIGAAGAARPEALPPAVEEGYELFALFPRARDSWLAEFRAETQEGVRTRYVSFDDPESGVAGKASSISRAAFEAALSPRPLSEAPAVLVAAARALGTDRLLVRARGEDGTESYWISGGRPEEALEAYAWLGPGGREAVLLRADGRAAVADEAGVRLFSAAPPAPGAVFSGVAALFGRAYGGQGGAALAAQDGAAAASGQGGGLAVAAWERGSFPQVDLAGFVVLPLP